MAVQELEIWAKTVVVDGVTEIPQRRDILGEEFDTGWVRLSTVSAQQMNGILHLLTTSAAPYAHCAYQMPSSIATPNTALDLNGNTFTEEDYPNLYGVYAGTLPDYTAEALPGMKWVIRAS